MIPRQAKWPHNAMNVIPTVGVLILKNDKVLLVKHGDNASHIKGIYGWPGGRLEYGESARQAAARELEEETGLKANPDELLEFIHDLAPAKIKRKNGEVKLFSAKLFVCESYTGELKGSGETVPEWVKISELDNYELLPNVKRMVEVLAKVE